MIKSKALLFAFAVCIFSIAMFNTQKAPCDAYAQYISSNEEELSITLLHPHIEKAITNFYGYSRRYEIGDSKLEVLKRDGNIFTVKVWVDTFEGAHNNYFTEILTFTITPSSVILKDYTHTDFTN